MPDDAPGGSVLEKVGEVEGRPFAAMSSSKAMVEGMWSGSQPVPTPAG